MTPTDRTALLVFAAIVAVGTGLRVASVQGDLWVDEIWSLDQIAVARASGLWRDWVALYFHDNTHALNSLFLTALGPNAPMWAYRVLALLCGIGAVIAAAVIGWRRDIRTGLLLAGMTAASYPFVHYAGEARGYGPMLFFAFAAYAALEAWLAQPARRTLILFVGFSLLGFASHLTFAVALAGFGAWAAVELYRARRDLVATAAALVPPFGLQLVAVLAYGAVAAGNFVVGGVTFQPAVSSVGTMAALTFGVDPAWVAAPVAAVAAGIAATAGLAYLHRCGDRSWLALGVVVIVFPAGGILIETAPYVLPRYFIVAAPFAMILAAHVLSRLWQDGGWCRAVAGTCLAGFVVGNGILLQQFLHDGRGHYGTAVADMAADAGDARIAGHPRFSVGTMFRYHARRQSLDTRLRFVDAKGGPADWFILGYLAAKAPPATLQRDAVTYALHRVYPHWGLSGDTWAVYRRR